MEKGNWSTLVDIRKVPEQYRCIFGAYPSFNRVQSTVFQDVLNSDHSIALSAPTGSGKTVVFELAIIRQLMAAEKSKYSNIFQIVYISPMKALCEERLIDWHKKFSAFGINCISITGDSDFIDFHSLSNHNLIITTPEKWDSITRRWKDNKRLIQVIKLFMIDEVHLLNEENRGATLEALVCRMKTIQSSMFNDNNGSVSNSRQFIRFLAVSATFPNIEDLGSWLGAKYYSFESSMRPVKLKTLVLGFNYNRSCSMFKFDISLNYRLPGLILKYSNGKPTLIFCSTRKSVEMASKHLIQTLTIPLNDSQKEILRRAASSITDNKLKSSIVHGIGYHHGGLLPEVRSIIEQLFRNGGLPVLVTTSTLATGVNLPAHLVIIKSTKFYDKGGFQDYSSSALLQMMGRAGRPQFDTEATALILTSTADMAKFEKMVDGKENIESNLHRHLTEHLNAEIVLRTITDLDVAMRWLSSTFLYIRARKNPRHYGIPLGMTADKIDKKLLEICQIDLNRLVKGGMASMDEDVNISPTFLGSLMAKYYISFESMKLFKSMNGNEILQQVLSLISKSKEFSDMRLRVDEKKCLNLLNKTKNENSIRFPFNGKIKTLDMKINCIIQAIFGCLEIEDQSILSEAFRIMRLGERICRCLIEYLETKDNFYSALLNATILWKCFRVQLWENSKHIAKQFPGIGAVTSKQLVNAGKTSIQKIIQTNPRELEMITKKKPPFGNKIVDLANSIPRYDMKIVKLQTPNNLTLKIILTLLNPEAFDGSFVNSNSVMALLIGNNLNRILLHERYMHSYMLENTAVERFVELNEEVNITDEVYCNFISEDLVGIDICETLIVNQKNSKEKEKKIPPKVCKSSKAKSTPKKLDPAYSKLVQSYMDDYMKCSKNIRSPALNKPVVAGISKNCFDPEELPASSKNNEIPSKNKEIPSKNNDIPSKNNEIPSKNYETSKNRDIPSINNDIPSKSNGIPWKNIEIPSKNNEIPSKNYEIPSKNNGIPWKNIEILSENNGISSKNNGIPSKNNGIPWKNIEIPSENNGIPSKNNGIPSENNGIPWKNIEIPSKNNDFSENYRASKGQGKNTPKISKENLDFSVTKSIIPNYNSKVSDNRCNIPQENSNRYSMSQFDETLNLSDIEDLENPKKSLIQPCRSFTDEEILESVELLLLDQNQDIGDYNQDTSDHKKEYKNVGSSLRTEFLGADLDMQFSKLHDKYGKKDKSEKIIENETQPDKRNPKMHFTGPTNVNKCIQKPLLSRKDKLHSVESFEKALFKGEKFSFFPFAKYNELPGNVLLKNPKTDPLSLFRYQPNKRLTHSSRNTDPPSAPESKRKKFDTSNEKVTEDMMDNLEKFIDPHEKETMQYAKSIKWRSPLVYSPPVKYSPKMSTSFSFSVPMPKHDSENSHDWSLNTVDTNNSSKTATPSRRSTLDTFKNQSEAKKPNRATKFLLSDREYNIPEKPVNNTIQNNPTPRKSQQIQDFFSSSLLEDAGYSENQRTTSNLRCFSQKSQDLNTSMQSAGAYYMDMVAKNMEAQRNAESTRQMSHKPFYLSQDQLTLPVNYSAGPKPNQEPGQAFERRSFVPFREQEVSSQNLNVSSRTANNFENPWLEQNNPQFQNILPRPEYEYNGQNILNKSSANTENGTLWNHTFHTKPPEQNRFSLGSQQMPKNRVGQDHIFPNSSLQSSFTNAIPYIPPENLMTQPSPIEKPNHPYTHPYITSDQNFDPRCHQNQMSVYSNNFFSGPDIPNKENLNYRLNIQNGNAHLRNINPMQQDSQGFFLNPPIPPTYFDGPKAAPLWNTCCVLHGIFNCFYCLNGRYSIQPVASRVGFGRQKSLTMSDPAEGEATRRPGPHEFLHGGRVPYSHNLADRTYQDNFFMDRDDLSSPYGTQPYGQVVRKLPPYESGFQNGFGMQNLNVPTGRTYQEFLSENNGNDRGNLGDSKSNKNFMVSKFLNSFDDSIKDQRLD